MKAHSTVPPPERALAVLARLRGMLRRAFLLDGATTLLLGVLVALSASFIFDYLLRLPWEVRLALLTFGLFGLFVAIRRGVRPLAMELRDDELAALLERAHPELGGSLLTAVELTRSGSETAAHVSPVLLGAAVRELEGKIESVGVRDVLDLRVLRRRGALGCALLIAAVSSALTRPDLAAVWAQRSLLLAEVRWPQRTQLEFYPPLESPVVVAMGDDFGVGVRVVRGDPELVVVRSVSSTGTERFDTMTESTTGAYSKTFANISRPFSFDVEGDDDSIGPVKVEVRLRPRIDMDSVRIWCEFPDYLGIASTAVDEPIRFGNLKVPVGTSVRFEMATNVDVGAAWLVLRLQDERERAAAAADGVRPAPDTWPAQGAQQLEIAGGRGLRGAFAVSGSGHYFIQLETIEGFRTTRPDRFRVEAIPDEAPTVTVVRPERLSEEVTANAVVTIRVDATDDYRVEGGGIEGVWLADPNATERPLDAGAGSSTDGAATDGAVPGVSVSLTLERVPGSEPAAGSEAGPPPGGDQDDPLDGQRAEERSYSGELRLRIASLPGEGEPPPELGARFQFYAVATDSAGAIGESPVYYLRVVDPDELFDALNSRLLVVRERLEEVRRQQVSARKDVEGRQDEARESGGLKRADAHKILRHLRDQERVRDGIEREVGAVARLLERARENSVGDKKWRDWVGSLQNGMSRLASGKATAAVAALETLRSEVAANGAAAGRLAKVLSLQMDLESELDMLILRLSEFGDARAMIQRLREIRKRQSEIRDSTRELHGGGGE